ncbi:ABC transporter permease [Jiangella sp. DSM 45060]|uniref:ABC transporter permease n=1 Tax=Jiangella sp. DSM 45060 TaxID=1798224 RepID=UPI000879A172|nr:ABC transporter permease [Jiangella sp. DSM 45060]SDT72285.1 peptide/nickel transport system permease protein [Jiangella sp. DSM 45060]
MIRYVLGRLPSIVVVLLVSSIIAFALPRLAPGDAAAAIAGPDATPEALATIRERLGLDQPLPVQYLDWVGGLFRGDLGTSYVLGRDVASLINDRLASTLELTLLAVLLTVLIALVLGTAEGSVRSGRVRTMLSAVNTLFVAMPPFLTGIILILVVGITYRLLPISGEIGVLQDPAEGLKYLILPAFALAIPQGAAIARLIHTSMRTARTEDFIDLVVAKGASPVRVTRHVLRNSLATGVVALGLRIGELLGGAIVIEAIFARNGLGQLAVTSASTRDAPVLQVLIVGAVLVAAVIQILTELSIAALDPRIRMDASA